MPTPASAAHSCSRSRGLRKQRARRDDRWSGDCGALLFLEPLAEEGSRKDLVPTLERALARAVGVEERLQGIDRLGDLVAEAARAGVVRAARDVAARRYGMVNLQIPVEPVPDCDHRMVEAPIFPVIV